MSEIAAPAARLLVVTMNLPHPSEGASTVLFHWYIDDLARRGYEILHVVILEPGMASPEAVAAHVERMRAAGRVRVETLEVASAVRSTWTTVDTMGHDRQVAALAEPFRPDLVVAFDIIPALLVRDLSCPRLVWLGDLAFEVQHHHFIYSTRENPRNLIKAPKVYAIALAWRRAYRRALAGATAVCASGSSVGVLAGLGLSAQYEPYPWPEAAGEGGDVPRFDKPSFLFFGTLAGLGSRSALHFLIEGVYPRLVSTWGAGGFSIKIAGRGGLPAWARDAIGSRAEFESLGFVEDLTDLMARCHAVIVPIDVPVGNRSRILTALARAVPVISHANAALGNPDLRDGETCLLASTAEGFAAQMVRAWEDPSGVRRIAERGQSLYRERFSPEVACGRFAGIVAGMLRHAQPSDADRQGPAP